MTNRKIQKNIIPHSLTRNLCIQQAEHPQVFMENYIKKIKNDAVQVNLLYLFFFGNF